MAQCLNKGDHIFIPFHKDGMSVGWKGPYIYKSLETCMKNYGKDADEIVEYAPIVRCGECRWFASKGTVEVYNGEGFCFYSCCCVDTNDFCSRGEDERNGD